MCDADLHIQDIVACWPGSAHNSTIFRHSNLRWRFELGHFGDFLLVEDRGYAVSYTISNYLLTPLSPLKTAAEDVYNESLIMIHNTVEHSLWSMEDDFQYCPKALDLVIIL